MRLRQRDYTEPSVGSIVQTFEPEYSPFIYALPNFECSPQAGGLLDRDDLVTALGCVPWTTELKDGFVPSVSPRHPEEKGLNDSGKDITTGSKHTDPISQLLDIENMDGSHSQLLEYWQ